MTYDYARLAKIKCFLFDMDGTINLGNELIPGMEGFFDKLKAAGKEYYLLTNNFLYGVYISLGTGYDETVRRKHLTKRRDPHEEMDDPAGGGADAAGGLRKGTGCGRTEQ